MIKAVLFDLDGVLIDATEVHYNALNEALEECGYKPILRKEHEQKYNGIPTREKLLLLNIPLEYQEIIQQKKQQKTITEIRKLKPIPDIVETLKFLKEQDRKIACCSNSITKTVVEGLISGGLFKFVDVILSNEDVEKPKPNPQIYLLAMNIFNLKPNECLIIEDSDKGYEAAIASGACVLKIKDPYQLNISLIRKYLTC